METSTFGGTRGKSLLQTKSPEELLHARADSSAELGGGHSRQAAVLSTQQQPGNAFSLGKLVPESQNDAYYATTRKSTETRKNFLFANS